MRLRLLVAVAAIITLAGCSDSTTSPQGIRPGVRSSDLLECRSGYFIVTRADGTQSCEEGEGQAVMATPPDSSGQ